MVVFIFVHMPKKKDLLNQKFGKLIVKSELNRRDSRGNVYWLCECDCGNCLEIIGYSLTSGNTKSCGCLNVEGRMTHGLTKSPTYNTWRSMIQRCDNPKNSSYDNYGAKGVKVCKEWYSFDRFLKDMGEKPENKSIDRLDYTANYCKDNCKWSSHEEQGQNRSSVKLNPQLVREIRCLWVEGISVKNIAKKLNLKRTTVCAVVHGRTWKNIQ